MIIPLLLPFLVLLLVSGGIALLIVLSKRKRAQRSGYPPAGYDYPPQRFPPHQAPPPGYGYPPRYGQPPAQPGFTPPQVPA